MHKIFMPGEGLVNLKLYVAILLLFEPGTGYLQCRNVIMLAEDHHHASAIAAQLYPEWEIQALTCLSDLPWFDYIVIDPNCPQTAALSKFVVRDIGSTPRESVPDGSIIFSFHKHRPERGD